ncbi:uncharacterized protein LOC123554901 [Mercenaria mercenaria]|uniref:uncharacterized protein LOC123554901 n=1 Tax=Mercenaria mercenaria TaxID=6596 RepID=UPI00234F0D2C|nr:uncharacterized protein LOC123554901 [Mercenaria mercenaria]
MRILDDMPGVDGMVNSGYQSENSDRDKDDDGLYIMTKCSVSHAQSHTKGTSDVDTSQEKELQHASNMSLSHSVSGSSLSNKSTASTLKVEIADIDNEESINLTTTTLRKCKRQVLRPYWRLLMFIGWRGFGREYINSGSLGWKFLNTVYPMFIIMMLFYTYTYEIIACQWKLNVEKDTQTVVTTTVKPTTPRVNLTTPDFFPIFSMRPAEVDTPQKNLSQSQSSYPLGCDHIVTTYVVPNFLHFVAFVMGLIHFRVQENEQLYALMESVFLQASPLHSRSASQQKMIRNMRAFFLFGALWILLTLGMQGLYEWAFDFPKLAFFVRTGAMLHWFLFTIDLLGILIINSIFVAVVTNYYTQCEMILFYVKGVAFRLQEKSIDLKAAMKNILSVRQNLSVLNGPIARMTALVSVIFAELTIIGVSILVLNKNNQFKVWMYRALYPVVWFIIAAIPLMQAARVNSVCNRFKKIALETRVFGYKGSSLLELDSFLNFVTHARLRAKLFHIPILPSYLISVVVLSLFVILILLQTNIIGTDHFF